MRLEYWLGCALDVGSDLKYRRRRQRGGDGTVAEGGGGYRRLMGHGGVDVVEGHRRTSGRVHCHTRTRGRFEAINRTGL